MGKERKNKSKRTRVRISSKSIKDHIDGHNLAVERSGFCPSCKRVHSKHGRDRAVYTSKTPL